MGSLDSSPGSATVQGLGKPPLSARYLPWRCEPQIQLSGCKTAPKGVLAGLRCGVQMGQDSNPDSACPVWGEVQTTKSRTCLTVSL